MSDLETLMVEGERSPAFRAALRAANEEELKELIGRLEGDPNSRARVGRFRAALRRLAQKQKNTP